MRIIPCALRQKTCGLASKCPERNVCPNANDIKTKSATLPLFRTSRTEAIDTHTLPQMKLLIIRPIVFVPEVAKSSVDWLLVKIDDCVAELKHKFENLS